MAWNCSLCNVEMEEVDDIEIAYGEMSLPEAEGIRCPVCGAEFILSDFVVGQLNSAEAMLDGK